MQFSSPVFLFLFLPLFLAVFFFLKREAHNSFLLAVSLVFYAWGDGRFVLLLLISIAANYLLGLLVEATDNHILNKFLFIMAVGLNLGLLIHYKYTGPDAGHLPLGISFFTFQAISFLVDIYRKTTTMDKNPLHFGLYMALFPKMATGPLVPYHQLAAQIKGQIKESRSVSLDDFTDGVGRFVTGLGKKILIADSMAVPANAIFALPTAQLTAGLSWLGILCYTLQIYYDFSGYTDMALGIGRMCGFKLPENFNYPYVAVSIKDFWKRWHISLAHWLRDYLFLPIAYGVSRKIEKPRLMGIKAENWSYFIAAFFTFLICGIWHGAAPTFAIWGAYHGLLLVFEHAGPEKRMRKKWKKPVRIIYCQLLVMVGWVIFRSPDPAHALSYLGAMTGFGGGDGIVVYPALYLDTQVLFFLVIGLFGSFPLVPRLKQWYLDRRGRPEPGWTYAIAYNLYLLVIFLGSAVTMAGGTYNPFIYARF